MNFDREQYIKNSRIDYNDIIGLVFGELTVVECVGKKMVDTYTCVNALAEKEKYFLAPHLYTIKAVLVDTT